MLNPRYLLRRIVGIRPQDHERLLLMAAYLLLIIASYTALKAVRDSMFVAHIGPSQLPYVYLLIAAAMGVVSYVYSRAVRTMTVYRLILWTSVLAVSNLLAFWWSFHDDRPSLYYVLYVWVSIFGAITASQFWLLANHVFDAREAKRVFAWIGVGGILGGILGGGFTRFFATRFGTERLLLFCALLMTLTVVLLLRVRSLSNAPALDSEQDGSKDTPDEFAVRPASLFRQVQQSRHLWLLTLLMGLSVIVEALIDYEYKFVAKASFPSKDQLTAFFGTIAAMVGVFSLLFQTLLTNRILRRFGVGAAILFLPSGLLAASVLLAIWPGLWAAAALQLIDGSLSYSIHRSGMELLYLPIPLDTKNAVKGFIDMFVDRFGRAIGGVILILGGILLASVAKLSLLVCGFLVAWIVVGFAMKREYLQSFRLALEKKTIEPEALAVSVLDRATLATLLRALTSNNERQVLYALDLLKNTHPDRWQKQIPALVQHSSSDVRVRAIELLAEWNHGPAAGAISKRLNDPDPRVRAEVVHYLCRQAADPSQKLHELVHHSDYGVVHGALQYMSKYGVRDDRLIDEGFIEAALNGRMAHEPGARNAAACALSLAWSDTPRMRGFLSGLLQDSSPEVVQQAMLAAGSVKYKEGIPLLIEKLADPRLRREARRTLLMFGTPIIPELIQYLQDATKPFATRRHIPKTLAGTGEQQAADGLLGSLHQFEYHLDYPMIKALNKIRVEYPDITHDPSRVKALIDYERMEYADLRVALDALRLRNLGPTPENPHDPAMAVLIEAIGERLNHRIEAIFRLLALMLPPRDVRSAFYICTVKPELRPSAIEFLDNLMDPSLKPLLMPLIEDSFEHEPDANASPGDLMSEEDVLSSLVASRDPWLQTLAVDIVGRRGAGTLREKTAPSTWELLLRPVMP